MAAKIHSNFHSAFTAFQTIFDAPLRRTYLGVLPFLLLNFVALMIITYVPEISMVLLQH
jgi:TRAP-type C4-dicarboxylate transport system permease large subunit